MLIGIDDTDIPGSRGTGKLARHLASDLETRGLGGSLSVTRHQLLVHPRINYTSHNSAACLMLVSHQEPHSVLQYCKIFLSDHFIPGSNPGLCVLDNSQVTPDAIDFGRSARDTILCVEQAYRVARESGALVEALGRTGEGVVGAVAAVGLRASGDDGRFIELQGIREVEGIVSVGGIKAKTAITSVLASDSVELADDSTVDTQSWLRPRLVRGRAVLVVEPHPNIPGGWISVDKSNKRNPDSKLR